MVTTFMAVHLRVRQSRTWMCDVRSVSREHHYTYRESRRLSLRLDQDEDEDDSSDHAAGGHESVVLPMSKSNRGEEEEAVMTEDEDH
jgi:hypothetical protein